MRLLTYDDGRVGRLVGDRVLDISAALGVGATPGISAMRTMIGRWDEIRPRLERLDGDSKPLDGVRPRVPVPDPTKIIAAPVNYRDHQSEMNVDAHVSALGFFLKAGSSLLDPGGTVRLPYHDRRFDQEGELALVIGREARRVSEHDALDHVFGYTGLLDITMRGGEDRSTRKSFDTFTPMGPVLVTADEVGPPGDIDLRCWVNGTLRQQANTRDLIWGVAKLVSYASWVTTLHPGDVISTGTPAGVGPLAHGDVVELDLARCGPRLTVNVAATGAVASHTSGRDRHPQPPRRGAAV